MHVYVHIPFCARRCSYCDFAIAVRREIPNQQLVDTISAEWRGRTTEWGAVAAINTLYFGGGTPSRVAPGSIAAILAVITAELPLVSGAEVTLETNPDDVTDERAHAWAAAGVNRISLGVQSHEPAVLEWMHRTHRAEQVRGAMRMLRTAGFRNISIDMIFALPAMLQRDWRVDLSRTLELGPQHLSLYGLTVEPHTPLFRWTQQGGVVPPPDERYADEYVAAHDLAAGAGFEHYEVSNAARAGFQSRHNSAYWSGADYIGLGPSAHSFQRGQRRWNVREWADYRARSTTGASVVGGTECPGVEARRLERQYLGLRTTLGVALDDLPSDVPDRWCEAGWATVSDGVLRLTVEGWLRLDALVAAARHS
ncbi:MAG: radical SAM family heme chaperone HemW [Gemmatimonadales bacterium]